MPDTNDTHDAARRDEPLDPTMPRAGRASRGRATLPGGKTQPGGGERTLPAARVPMSPVPRTPLPTRVSPTTVGNNLTGSTSGTSGTSGGTRTPSVPSGVVPKGLGEMSRYQFASELGRGAVGVVMAASDPDLRRQVAIKLLLRPDDPDAVDQFMEEAQITGQLEHPNIIPVHELGRDAHGRPWLAMKRIDGITLGQLIEEQRPGPLDPSDLARMINLFGKVCDAMAFAHARGVIHRDLKPDNVMIGEFGEVLVADWGLARPTRQTPDHRGARARTVTSGRRVEDAHMTMDGEIFGTPAYMPPEQADGRVEEVDERSDIFALGGILYHMLTLERPYMGRDVRHVLLQAAQRQLDSPRRRAPHRHIPVELDAIVMKAMALKRTQRYVSVRDLQRDLDAFQANRSVSAHRDGFFERAVKWARRHPTATMGTGLSLLFVVLLGGMGALLAAQSAAADHANAVANASERARKAESEARNEAELRAKAETAARQQSDLRAAAEADSRKLAELRVLAESGKVEELLAQLGQQLQDAHNEAYVSFHEAWQQARRSGISDRVFIGSLGEFEVQRAIDALENLFDAHRRYGDRSPVTSDDNVAMALMLQVTRNQPERVVEFCNEAVRLDALNSQAYTIRSMARQELGDLDAAAKDLAEALRIEPANTDAWNASGLLKRKLGDLPGSKADFDQALLRNPGMVAALVNRGVTNAALGDTAAALADLNQALRLAPGLTDSLYNRGRIHHQAGNYDLAIDDFSSVLSREPDLHDARYELARSREAAGQYENAVRDYSTYLKAEPGEPYALQRRGVCLLALDRPQSALADFDAAIKAAPEMALNYFNRGQALRALERPAEAIEAFNRSLGMDPQHANSWFNRGNARSENGDEDGALADYNRAVELQPDNVAYLIARGVTLAKGGDNAAGAADFRRCTRLAPDRVEPWINLAIALKEIEPAESLRAFQEAYRRAKTDALRKDIAESITEAGGTIPD